VIEYAFEGHSYSDGAYRTRVEAQHAAMRGVQYPWEFILHYCRHERGSFLLRREFTEEQGISALKAAYKTQYPHYIKAIEAVLLENGFEIIVSNFRAAELLR
jgi:hypothetical protein